jgi:hypothetical protein
MSDHPIDTTDSSSGPSPTQSPPGTKEFIVEILGSLVPGSAFLFLLLPAFVIPVFTVCQDLFATHLWPYPVLTGTMPTTVSTILFILFPAGAAFLVFSYIAGHLFRRHDPKHADEASFESIPRRSGHAGMCRPESDGNVRVEFPYHFLKQYLNDRGIEYLAQHVPWDATNFTRRAKHWANALKIRIALECPKHYGVLANNEAHVRLSSSMWFVCRALMGVSLAGILITFGAVIATKFIPTLPPIPLRPVIFLPTATLILSWAAKWSIERTLHYQREREVLFILETAHWVWLTKRAPLIFDGLRFEEAPDA